MSTDPQPDHDRFIYVVCQRGAETAAKKEITTAHPNLRLAFSRPGFVTFKIDLDSPMPERFTLRSTLARTYGWSLGKANGIDANELVDEVIDCLVRRQISLSAESAGDLEESGKPPDALINTEHSSTSGPIGGNKNAAKTEYSSDIGSRTLHVWQRDGQLPGNKGFEPGITPLSHEIGNLFINRFFELGLTMGVNRIARPNEKILDVVLVEPDQWWYGYHYATTVPGRWPGGVPMIDTSIETVSRAYFKAQEALAWSGIEIQAGDHCAEIGSSPGGCCQLLLELGANVIGIDPAEMEPELLKNEKFTHIRRRGHEVRKRDFKDVKWLFADLSMVPNYTLDTVAEIVGHSSVNFKGMVLTMKVTDWKLVDEVPQQMNRVREMGFSVVKTRQLAFNRQEFCLVAVKDKFLLRAGKKQAQQKRRTKKS